MNVTLDHGQMLVRPKTSFELEWLLELAPLGETRQMKAFIKTDYDSNPLGLKIEPIEQNKEPIISNIHNNIALDTAKAPLESWCSQHLAHKDLSELFLETQKFIGNCSRDPNLGISPIKPTD